MANSTNSENIQQPQSKPGSRRRRIIITIARPLLLCLFVFGVLLFLIMQPLLYVSKNQPAVKVDPERLKLHVMKLSEEFSPRDYKSVVNLDRTAAYISREFSTAKGQVTEQVFQVDKQTYRNVIAQFGPDTAERIVVGAHYDGAGPLPAADDNASGVAGLIELAYLLGQTNNLPMRVELVAYSLEEPPYFYTDNMGSYYHAQELKRQNITVPLMISIETIGYFSDQPGSQKYPINLLGYFYPDQGNFIIVVGKLGQGWVTRNVKAAMAGASELPVYSISALPSVQGIDFSDHYQYWNAGYPAVMITDTAFNRYQHYHKKTDTYEKLNYDKMSMVIIGVYNAVLAAGAR